MRKILFAAFLFCFIQTYAKDPPIPEALVNAKTAFVRNDGAEAKDYDKLCKLLREWGQFELVQDRKGADLVITLLTQPQYRTVRLPAAGGSLGTVQQQQVLISYIRILSAKDDSLLWSDETPNSKDPKYLVNNLKNKMKKK